MAAKHRTREDEASPSPPGKNLQATGHAPAEFTLPSALPRGPGREELPINAADQRAPAKQIDERLLQHGEA